MYLGFRVEREKEAIRSQTQMIQPDYSANKKDQRG
jgi:hypothetical protein